MSYWISSKVRFGGQILHLILAGLAVSALFSAGVGILKYVADPIQQLPEIVFWLLGGLWAVKMGRSGLYIAYYLNWNRINFYISLAIEYSNS